MKTLTNTFTSSLQKSGMRLTPQRLAICKLLAENPDHPTALQIFKELKSEYPSLSLATVYNTLEVLVGLGCINALGNAWDDTLHYDPNLQPHINLMCISCHEIEDIPTEHVNHLVKEIIKGSGFKTLGARIVYYGLCTTCQSEQVAIKNPINTQ